MNWFYAQDGQQKGPVSEMEFTTLAREGVLKADTLVWREGMPSWVSLDKVRPDLAAATGAPVISGMAVAEQNKDLVVQQLREGVLSPGMTGVTNPLGFRYAGFWIRVAAKLIDGVLMTIVNYALMFLLFGSLMMTVDPSTIENMENNPEAMTKFWVAYIAFILLSTGFNIGYAALMTWKWGATLGKMAVGIKVVQADGEKIGLGRSIGRSFADILNGFICGLTYLMPAFDEPEKRGLHDHICSTRVIYK